MKKLIPVVFVLGFLSIFSLSGDPVWAGGGNQPTISQVIREFKRGERSKVGVLKYATVLMGNADDYLGVKEILSQVEGAGIELDRKIYSSAIHRLIQWDGSELAFQLLTEMKERLLAPDSVAYSEVINCLANEGRVDLAKRLMAEMHENRLPVDRGVYIALLRAYANDGNPEGALELLEDIKRKMSPDVVMYAWVIHAYVQVGYLDKGVPFFLSLVGNVFSRNILAAPYIDFHRNQFYTAPTFQKEVKAGRMDPNHVNGVSVSVATMALWVRHRHSKRPFPGSLVYGRNGDGLLREALMAQLTDYGYRWREREDGGSLAVEFSE